MESIEKSPREVSRATARRRAAVASAIVLALAVLVLALLRPAGVAPRERLSYSELLTRAEAGDVLRVDIDGEKLRVALRGGESLLTIVPAGESQQAIVAALTAKGAVVEFAPHEVRSERVAGVALPILVLAAIGAVGYFAYKKRGLSHVKHVAAPQPGAVSFKDVAGVDEAKQALTETIEFLRDPMRFGRLGGRAPRGVLLAGQPGTGKTLLARAAATEAGVPFISASGSGFQELFVGVGASRVRSLFAEARRVAPCVLFVDEIDALGKRRGRGDDSASADADQMLNQLLIEMDGFDPTTGIVVLASTNRPDVLDPALLRPGRFDRQITVAMPDLRGREQILAVHARRLVLAPAFDLHQVARATPGFTGADLARLLNEAAILAAREGAQAIAWDHVERARDRVLMGDERHGMIMGEDERYATAVHEAGHVAVGLACVHHDPIHKVSILPRGRALGVTQAMPERDRLMYRREYLEDRIAMLLGGRAAEQVVLGTMTAGAADDIERAFDLARRMVAEMGMSPLGPIHPGTDLALRSPAALDRIEHATSALVNAQLERAIGIVSESRRAIERLVTELLERDTLGGAEIRACFDRADA